MTDRTSERPPDEQPKLKEYEGEGITVTFEPRRCLHAAECVHGLPEVFDLSRRPWVLPDAAEPALVAEVVRRCPSGALQYHPAEGPAERPDSPTTVHRTPSGQLVVRGDLLVSGATGERHETRVMLCGCGASGNQPYCDHSGPCAEPDDDVPEQR
ncbi:(4Fe-4S)-binding protein [Streptomyces sp. SR27]|uniref:(4Fe-4S)-binding protein n=1 Tax=Streptomyces sp. SR27 TaxID=3076630 RepID=UPI00295A972E|nr:(4Fe-4S)-binding protein [Streptomyces sp. SR27]MDV9190844.1 (4Fe-4S)-binding protein [Streptomyces sp. SR27]